ncbi:MAG TPA: SDR family NAD(P)-dependent oxidoreductase, partial [Nitrososphaeraceae archaeon]
MKRTKNQRFDEKIVLITGASSGIGRQAAIDFADKGARAVILVARTLSKLGAVEKMLRTNPNSIAEAVTYSCDISRKTDVIRMGKDIIQRFGRVDILVNNAGFGIYGKVVDQTIEDIEAITCTNYLGTVYCSKVFLNSMINRRSGHIVNVASVAASFGVAGLAAYCGAKYAVLGFSESLYHELHGAGVGITVVSPIAVKTNFFNNETFKNHMPNYTGFALEPKIVSKAILAAAKSPRLEIMVPFFMRAG